MNQFDVKKIILVIMLGMFLSVFPSVLGAQNLEIHYINVQQGGCTLIIGPDGTTVLYDGGYELKGTNEIIPYLQGLGITTAQALDYVIAGHRDTDHYRGLTEVMMGGYDALNVYDNGSDKYNIYVQEFLDAAATTTAGGVTPMPLGHVINLGNGAKATVVATNGSVLGFGPVPNGQDNENDRAIALLVQYGDFDYLLHGDMGGGNDDYDCTGRSTSQINIETPLVMSLMPAGGNPMLNQYGAEVAHVAHHGSESSTNSDYMNLLSPAVACINVGAGQSTNWYHPRMDVVENVLLAQAPCVTVDPALVLQTEEGSPIGEKTSTAGYSVGDIVITTNGVNSYTVSASGAVSQGPDERIVAGLPATFFFDEYLALDNPPALYNIHDENLTETTVDIAWTTNEIANSVVKYGTTSGSYPNTLNNATLELNHSLTLAGLNQAETYYYVVESTDATAHTTVSVEYNFTTGGTAPDKVVFSEIFYDTPGTDSDEEWIELYNNSETIVDLSGWTITDNNDLGGTYTIPSGTTIKPGTYLTIAADSAGFNALYGYDADVYGSFPGLNNSGDALLLKDSAAVLMDTAAWEGGAAGGVPADWGSTSQPSVSTGNTIVRSDPTVDTDTYLDWTGAADNGNPQTQTGAVGDKVLFSEVFYDTPGDENKEEWIELYNSTAADVDISGWAITDNNGTGYTYSFPAGASIKAGTYLTVGRDSAGFTALYGYEADFYGNLPYLNNGGDTIILYDSANNQIDAVAWEGGASAGIPEGWGSTSNPWAGSGNTIVRTEPAVDTDTYADWGYATDNGDPQTQDGGVVAVKVVFSEIFYDTLGDETKEEWFEIYNDSAKLVDLSGWKVIDNNGTGWTYTFPAGSTIKAGTFMTIARDSAGFIALYSYEADLYGNLPYLNNGGDTLILYDTENNEIDAVAWEGGASGGIPEGWGSTSNPWASAGNVIVRADVTVDTDTYADWTYATEGGNPQTQIVPGNILFSELSYDTPGTDSVEEWIELYNNSPFDVNIGGWTITDNNGTGSSFVIPDGTTMTAGTFLTIAANSTGFTALYTYNADVYGSIPALNNSGDTLILYDTNGDVKDFVAWEGGASSGIPTGWGSTSNPWTSTGNTIVRSDYTVDTDTYNDWTYATDGGFPQTQEMGVPDTTPPVISNVAAGSITIDSAVITWTTDEPADSVVEYGTESGNYVGTLNDGSLTDQHSMAITGLNHNTTYYYHVISTDESGNVATSDEYSFKTLDIMTNTLSLVDYKHTNDVYGQATFTVTDSNGAPVADAVLNITWSGDYYTGTDTGTTDANGQIMFMSGRVHPNKWAFTVTVDSITKAGFFWDAANSVVTASINKHKNKED
jgi:beta-lactamase superfamily II metal-dependent hydrolase